MTGQQLCVAHTDWQGALETRRGPLLPAVLGAGSCSAWGQAAEARPGRGRVQKRARLEGADPARSAGTPAPQRGVLARAVRAQEKETYHVGSPWSCAVAAVCGFTGGESTKKNVISDRKTHATWGCEGWPLHPSRSHTSQSHAPAPHLRPRHTGTVASSGAHSCTPGTRMPPRGGTACTSTVP